MIGPLHLWLLPAGMALAWFGLQAVRRPVAALGLLLAITVLIDQNRGGPDSPFVIPAWYDNLSSTLGVGALLFNPIEVLLAAIALGWLTCAVAGRTPGRPLLVVSWLGLAWALAVACSAWWGFRNGGNYKIGLWILRPVMYFLGAAFLTYQLVRGPRQAAWLWGILVATVAIKAMTTCGLWLAHRNDGREWECYVGHEDSSFALLVLWFALAAFLLRGLKRPRLLYCLAPLILLAVVFNDRRINFVTLALGVVLIVVAMPWGALVRRGLWMAVGTALVALYATVGVLGPENAATKPVKGIVTGLQAEVKGWNTDDSSQYRKIERYDLLATIRAYPVLGTGLGVRYLQPLPLPTLCFAYRVYIPHNQVLMVHAVLGPAAYFVLLVFYLVLFGQLLSHYRRLREPWHRCLALAAAASVANWLIVGYYDMQLFFFRNSLFMGVAVALPACLMRWQEERDAQAPAPPSSPPS